MCDEELQPGKSFVCRLSFENRTPDGEGWLVLPVLDVEQAQEVRTPILFEHPLAIVVIAGKINQVQELRDLGRMLFGRQFDHCRVYFLLKRGCSECVIKNSVTRYYFFVGIRFPLGCSDVFQHVEQEGVESRNCLPVSVGDGVDVGEVMQRRN